MKRKRPSKKSKAGRRGKYVLYFICAIFIFGLYFSFSVVQSCEHIDTTKIYSYISQSSVIYDVNGNEFDNIYLSGGNRRNVTYDEMPEDLINAAVSIEDKTFWKHHGFNFIRMGGAIFDSIRSGGSVSGTSTITQQLARNVYLASTKSDRTLTRKVSEAYYTVILERGLSKKNIMEAYLNTIYFGYGSYGVETAARTYFNKSASELDLAECVALMAIPNSPDRFALVKRIPQSDIASGKVKVKQSDIITKSSDYTIIYNGDASEARRNITLENMYKYGYITKSEMEQAKKVDLKKRIDTGDGDQDYSGYFTDFVIKNVRNDLMDSGYSEANANALIYTGGLKIYTSLDPKAQSSLEEMFRNDSNFPSVANVDYDSSGNILNSDGNLMLYKYGNYFDGRGNFSLKRDEFETDSDGNIILKKGRRLIFEKTKYKRTKSTYAIEFRNMYRIVNGTFYVIEGGEINIDPKYKSLNSSGDLVIDASFFKDHPDAFTKTSYGYTVPESSYTLSPQVRQPQAAMVIINNKTGAVAAMIGGRESSGSMLYNRAENPRQPGSSIKPLAIYSSALQQGADAVKDNRKMTFSDFGSNTNEQYYGNYWTARSYINDAPLTINGKVWPKNWYSGYRGEVSLRTAVEQSINVCAVRVWQQMDNEYITDQLEKFGITTVVKEEDNSDTNDMNAAALALGGMTNGVSPLEMASAYMTFQNGGTHIEYSAYSRVSDQNGTVILDKKPKETRVMSEGVAFIMSDILHTTVTNGIAGDAQVSGQPTAGKTGTTTDNYDAWFCGFTPQYSAALWIGNDYNIELSQGSAAAARLWSLILSGATAGSSGSFAQQPSSVIYYNGEYFINGTQYGSYYYRKPSKKQDTKDSTTQNKQDQIQTEQNTESGT